MKGLHTIGHENATIIFKIFVFLLYIPMFIIWLLREHCCFIQYIKSKHPLLTENCQVSILQEKLSYGYTLISVVFITEKNKHYCLIILHQIFKIWNFTTAQVKKCAHFVTEASTWQKQNINIWIH